MNESIGSSRIAAILKISVQAVNQRAVREKWTWQKKSGRGGGREYPFATLPTDVQTAILKAESRQFLAEHPLPLVIKPTPAPPDPALKAAGDAMAAHLSGKPLARLDAKLAILSEFRRWVKENPATGRQKPGGKLHKEGFATAWNRGDIASQARAVIPRLTADQLNRWPAQLQRAGLAALAGRYGNRRGQNLIDQQPQLAVALRSILIAQPHISHVHAHEFLCARYHGSALRLPSLKTVARWMNAWKAEQHSLFCKLSDPDRWKSTYQSAIGDASAAILALNQEWQADSTPADLELADGRHTLIFLLDVYSRRLKIHVSKTSTAAAIAAVLRRGLLDWGVPEVLKTDNGADYVSDHINRICHALSIDHRLCAPFTPEGKGHVERHVQTFSHDLLELLPGYLGHNVAERQALRAREQFSDRLGVKNALVPLGLDSAQLQAFCDRWCDAYHNRPHRGLAGQTPNQIVNAWREPTRAIADERALDILLAPAPSNNGWRTVSKSDQLKIDGFTYVSVALALHINERVRVMYDETDMGRVYVFDGRGQFIAVAECPELTGLDRRQFAIDSKTLQKHESQRLAREAKAESRKTLKGPATVEAVLDFRAAQAREQTPAPQGVIEHTTPYIQGAAQALLGHDALSGDDSSPGMPQIADCFHLPPVGSVADVVALPTQRRIYDSHPDRIRDVFARFFDYGVEPDVDDLFILHEFYDDRNYLGAIHRFDESLRARHRQADIDALKQRWLVLPLPLPPSAQAS